MVSRSRHRNLKTRGSWHMSCLRHMHILSCTLPSGAYLICLGAWTTCCKKPKKHSRNYNLNHCKGTCSHLCKSGKCNNQNSLSLGWCRLCNQTCFFVPLLWRHNSINNAGLISDDAVNNTILHRIPWLHVQRSLHVLQHRTYISTASIISKGRLQLLLIAPRAA